MKKFKNILCVFLIIMLLVSVMPMTIANADGEFVEITTKALYEMYIDSNGETVRFIPDSDGWYMFYTVSDLDTRATLYNSDFEIVENRGGTSKDFDFDFDYCVVGNLKAGGTYYLDVKVSTYYELQKANVSLYVKKAVDVKSMEITQCPFDTNLVEDNEYETFTADGLEIAFTFADGTTIDWKYQKYYLNDMRGYIVDVYLDCDYAGNYYACVKCAGLVEKIPYTVVKNNTILLGDVDGDAKITIMDASEIQMVIAQRKPDFKDITVADVDGDSRISIFDATAIQMQLAKIE